MTSVLDKLNFFRYSKETFINEKSKIKLVCTDRLTTIIKLIEGNVKKSGGDNSSFTHTSYGHNRTSYGSSGKYGKHDKHDKHDKHYKNDKSTNSKGKSWRLTKTSIIPKDISVIDKHKNEINSLLNKLTSKNYDSIVKKIIAYYTIDSNDLNESDESDESNNSNILVDKTITNVFMKAVMQPIYCPSYVKFLNLIGEKYNKSNSINKKCIEFKQVIQVQEQSNKEGDTISEQEQYDLFCKANTEKRYKEGYSQFIGEMFNKNMISRDTLIENVEYFVTTLEEHSLKDIKSLVVEDILICLCKLMVTIKNRETKPHMLKFIKRITKIKDIPGLQKRLQFKILDLHDNFKR